MTEDTNNSDLNTLEKLKRLADLMKKQENEPENHSSQKTESATDNDNSAMEMNAKPLSNDVVESLLQPTNDEESNKSHQKYSFDEFVDERMLISRDLMGKKEMKVKVLEVSDEHPPLQWKFGDRVKVNKILITIKHLETQQIEEGECDIEAIEKELTEKRHYTSTNRWIPTNEIKNGYVVASRHTSLISDAAALDYIVF
ncbi:hypothetical protein [Nitrosopumilus sp. b1]|uniref:hypothetical protein n=1 Tax=Nitrosopumilus sp. b1 TaxID=2109907 RepID=UPI0031831946